MVSSNAVHKAIQAMLGNKPLDFQSTIEDDYTIMVPSYVYRSNPLFRERLFGVKDLNGRPSLTVFSEKDLANLESLVSSYTAEPLRARSLYHTVIEYRNAKWIKLYLNKPLARSIGLGPEDVVSVSVNDPDHVYTNGYLVVASDGIPRTRFTGCFGRNGLLEFPELVVASYAIFSEKRLVGSVGEEQIIVLDMDGISNFSALLAMDSRGHVNEPERRICCAYTDYVDITKNGVHLPRSFRKEAKLTTGSEVKVTVAGPKGELFPKGYIMMISHKTE